MLVVPRCGMKSLMLWRKMVNPPKTIFLVGCFNLPMDLNEYCTLNSTGPTVQGLGRSWTSSCPSWHGAWGLSQSISPEIWGDLDPLVNHTKSLKQLLKMAKFVDFAMKNMVIFAGKMWTRVMDLMGSDHLRSGMKINDTLISFGEIRTGISKISREKSPKFGIRWAEFECKRTTGAKFHWKLRCWNLLDIGGKDMQLTISQPSTGSIGQNVPSSQSWTLAARMQVLVWWHQCLVALCPWVTCGSRHRFHQGVSHHSDPTDSFETDLLKCMLDLLKMSYYFPIGSSGNLLVILILMFIPMNPPAGWISKSKWLPTIMWKKHALFVLDGFCYYLLGTEVDMLSTTGRACGDTGGRAMVTRWACESVSAGLCWWCFCNH